MIELPISYVTALERLTRQGLSSDALHTKTGKAWIERIAEQVESISRGLTKDREEFIARQYLKEKLTREAYLVYYMTTNLLKLWPPLRELAQAGLFDARSEIRHLDIGSGTGAAVWGLATYLDAEQSSVRQLHTLATDLLTENLESVRAFLKHFETSSIQYALETKQLDASSSIAKSLKGQTFDLVTAMNVMNEIAETRDEELLRELFGMLEQHGALVVIEPATKLESRRTLRFRDRAIEAGFFVYSPCCRSGACPALMDTDNWCHTEIPWERPAFIKAIDDLVGTLRLSLKSTYFVLLKQDQNLSDHYLGGRDFVRAGRVVSERFDEKGRTRFSVCNEPGINENVRNKRDRGPENRQVEKIERYDLILSVNVERREHDVKITGASELHILSRADGCGYVDKSMK